MRLGILVFSSKTGLGYQSRSYAQHLNPAKLMHIDISSLNGAEQDYDWYKDYNTVYIKGIPNRLEIKEFLKGLDVVLMAETPMNYELYTLAKRYGVKVANVINWEFFDHIIHPDYPLPDLIIMPSAWYADEARVFCEQKGIKMVHLHHPVDRSEIPFRLRTTPTTYHIAGKPASYDRNGTWTYMSAVPDGRVVTQDENFAHQIRKRYRHSKVYTNMNHPQIFDVGDIMVLPRRYGGNCLPLNEALSAGCPVIMPDISPNNKFLPPEWLVPAKKIDQFTPRTTIDIYEMDQEELRKKIEWFRNTDMKKESEKANKLADSISWETMKDKYLRILSDL